MEGEIKATTNHELIRSWAENRGGKPAKAPPGEEENINLLRIKFSDEEKDFKETSWEEFLYIFEDKDLIFLYQDELEEVKNNHFHKFAPRHEYLSPNDALLPEEEEEWIIEAEEDY